MKATVLLSVLLILSSCAFFRTQTGPRALPGSLEEAVDSSDRAEENSDRDEYQHPLETLKFFGVTPEMTVVEISPGAGYYTEILAPYLAKQGQYVMAIPRLPSNPPQILLDNEAKIQNILLRHPDVQHQAKIIPFEPIDSRNRIKPASADLVISISSVHNWVAQNSVPMAFKFFHDILKPGGILGIVQHRVAAGKKNFPKSGYLTESEVIAMAKKGGFRLAAKSEVNANPKDTADYPEGVWTLPPFYRLGEVDRDKYEDIGESDRMTLKFVKVPRRR